MCILLYALISRLARRSLLKLKLFALAWRNIFTEFFKDVGYEREFIQSLAFRTGSELKVVPDTFSTQLNDRAHNVDKLSSKLNDVT